MQRFYIYFILAALAALSALSPGLRAAAQATDSVGVKLSEKNAALEELRKVFADKFAKDSSNRGAKNMNYALLEVARGAEAYLEGDFERDLLLDRLSAALEEASRYSSEEAVRTQTLLRELKSLAEGLPARYEPPSAKATQDSARQTARPAPPQRQPAEPVAAEEPEETGAGADADIVYILFGVYLIAILLFGYLLYSMQTKKHKQLAARLAEAEQKVNSLTSVKESGDDYAKIQLKQTERKYDTLEKNTADFLKMYEERLENLELASGRVPQNKKNVDKIAGLEERLERLEAFIRKNAEKISAPQTVVKFDAELTPNEAEHLIDAIEHLHDATDIFALKRAAENVLPDLKRALISHSWAAVDVYEIARLAQLAYVSQFNEATDESWQQIAKALRKAGFNLDAKMAGKPCFTLDYARNLTLQQYNQIPRFQTPEYPNAVAVRNHIEQKFNLSETPPETILYVLNPTVSIGHNGSEVVLQKGAYVVSE